METKLITKTIKELADEYDGNVEQLHREIRRYNQVYDCQKKEIESLRYGIEFERCERAKAEEKLKKSIVAMSVLAVLCSIILLLKF